MVPSWALFLFPLSLLSFPSLSFSLFASARAFYAALLSSLFELLSSVTAYSYLVPAYIGVYSIVLLVFCSFQAVVHVMAVGLAVLLRRSRVPCGSFSYLSSFLSLFLSLSVLLSVSLFLPRSFFLIIFSFALFSLDYTRQLRISGILDGVRHWWIVLSSRRMTLGAGEGCCACPSSPYWTVSALTCLEAKTSHYRVDRSGVL